MTSSSPVEDQTAVVSGNRNINFTIDDSVPPGEVWAIRDAKIVGKITGLDTALTGQGSSEAIQKGAVRTAELSSPTPSSGEAPPTATADQNAIDPKGLEWERVTRAAWRINPDWSKAERQAIEDFILTARCYIAEVDPDLTPEEQGEMLAVLKPLLRDKSFEEVRAALADLLADAETALAAMSPPTPHRDNALYYPLLFLVRGLHRSAPALSSGDEPVVTDTQIVDWIDAEAKREIDRDKLRSIPRVILTAEQVNNAGGLRNAIANRIARRADSETTPTKAENRPAPETPICPKCGEAASYAAPLIRSDNRRELWCPNAHVWLWTAKSDSETTEPQA